MMVYISLSSCYCFCFLEYLSQLYTIYHSWIFKYFIFLQILVACSAFLQITILSKVFPSARLESFLFIDLASRDFIFCLRIYLPCLRLRRTLCLTVGALSASQSQASVESQRPIRSQLTLTVGLCLALADFCLIWGEPGQRLFLPF